MKRITILGLLIFIGAIFFTGCVEPYPPPVSDNEAGYLVVDGFLNASDGSVKVKLSRAIPLSSTDLPPAETQASIELEDSDGNSFPLMEQGSGIYSASELSVDFSKKYKLLITTTDNQSYESDLVEIKQVPPIDDLTWQPTPQGVKILVNAHDDNKKTIYYQWLYEETYEQHAVYYSAYVLEEGEGRIRTPEEEIYTCWKDEYSQNIIIGTSQRLSVDVISDFPVTLLPVGSPKLYVRYSILVKQRALTKEAYTYYDKLKKTTEDLGGLFDPQPGQVTGNIKNLSNPGEVVLGYFSGGSEVSQRIFIKVNELPTNIRRYQQEGNCYQDTVLVEQLVGLSGGYNLINGVYEQITLVGYTYSSQGCTDCRKMGGTLTKPDFW